MKRLFATFMLLTQVLLFASLSSFSSFSFAQATFKGVVAGDELDWESYDLSLTLEVSETANLEVDIYSPGFDPNDYRSALNGLNELGDERYDKAAGNVAATFTLASETATLTEKSYGVEAHRTDTFASLTLEPGKYTLNSSLAGLAKNAFIYTFTSEPASAVRVFIEPSTLILNPQGDSAFNYTIMRGDWRTPFAITVPEDPNPVTVSIYDGDGAEELMLRLGSPDGSAQELPVSGDRQWRDYVLNQVGQYNFSFRVPDAAYQYSNTIGVKVDQRLQLEGNALRVVRPAIFSLTKTVDQASAQMGDTLTYTLKVTNVGEAYGTATLVDVLPEGLTGEHLEQGIALFPGQSQAVTVQAVINGSAGMQIVNTATLTSSSQLLEASAVTTIEVPPPVALPAPPVYELTKTANVSEVMVGDSVIFTVTVSNVGGSKGIITLRDLLPEGYEGVGIDQTFPLVPGDTRTFIVGGRVLDSAPNTLMNEVVLTDGSITTSATALVKVLRPAPEPESVVVVPEVEVTPEVAVTPEVEPVVEPEPTPEIVVAQEFEQSRFSEIDLYYRAGDIITCDLGTFAPGESRDLTINLQPDGSTISDSRFSTMAEGLKVSKSDLLIQGDAISYVLRVSNPGAEQVEAMISEPLPTGTVFAGSEGCVPTTDLAQQILITHVPPTGSSYDVGSSQLNGEAISDPFTDEDGRLYWVIPFSSEGVVSYLVQHTDALPPVEQPTLTIATSDRELQLVGNIPFSDLEQLITTSEAQSVSDKPLASIEVRPLEVVADNRNPVRLELRAVDEDGNLASAGMITLDINADFVQSDADPLTSGYQVALTDGRAVVELAPQPSPRTLEIRAEETVTNALEAIRGAVRMETTVQLSGVTQGLYQYQVSATASFGGGVNVAGIARGYAEVPFAGGSLQAAVDIGADTVSGIDTQNSLATQVNPTERYPLLSTGEEAQPALRSDDGVAVRYDSAVVSTGYYSDSLNVPGVDVNGSGTALHLETHGDLEAKGFAAVIASDTRTVEIIPDGTRTYFLDEAVRAGSERIIRRSSEGEEILTRLVDYTINYSTGDITLARPLWSSDGDFNDVRLVVTYAPENAPRDQLAFGIGATYTAGDFSVGAGVSQYGTFKIGFEAAYTTEDFYAKGRYTRDFGNANKAATDYATFNIGGAVERFSADLNLTYSSRLQGNGEVRYQLFESGSIYARHTAANTLSRTELGYQQSFGTLRASLGIGYDWIGRYLAGIAGLGYEAGALDVALSHAQPFTGSAQAQTTLTGKYAIDSNLTAEAALAYVWGRDLSGTVGLVQDLGNANLRLEYQLPTASGEGNRARGGVEVPLALSENLELNAHAGVEVNINDNTREVAFGAALRYSVENFNATFGAEVALPSVGGTKLVLRSGVSGQLSKDQTIALDANYQIVPELRGRFGIAYALKLGGLNFLTYHRLVNNPGANTLEGEVSPAYVLSPAFQIRPSFAYRVNFDDSEANTYQATLGGVYYFDPRLGDFKPTVGAGLFGHYVWQPGTGSSDFGVTLELSAQVIENLWAKVGYTFPTDLEGLTSSSRGGFYIGIDLLGSGQF